MKNCFEYAFSIAEIELKGDLLKKLQEELQSLTTKNNDFERCQCLCGKSCLNCGLICMFESGHQQMQDLRFDILVFS